MDIHIRPMTFDDIQAVVLIDIIAGILMPWSPTAYITELRKPTSWQWVAETITEEPLAYIPTYPLPIDDLFYPAGARAVIGSLTMWKEGKEEGRIANLAVHPKFWRQGVGRALMQTALNKAAQLGLTRLRLEVRADNEPAQRLYRSLGFVEYGRSERFYTNGQDAVLMSLQMPSRDG